MLVADNVSYLSLALEYFRQLKCFTFTYKKKKKEESYHCGILFNQKFLMFIAKVKLQFTF